MFAKLAIYFYLDGRNAMLKKSTFVALFALAGIGLSACDVDQTQEGDVKLPDYEVEKTQEGNVAAPAYEVTPPEVDVTEKERTVEVPTIETEEKKIDVPQVDVEPAKENESAKADGTATEK
jgi:hypothetical protein